MTTLEKNPIMSPQVVKIKKIFSFRFMNLLNLKDYIFWELLVKGDFFFLSLSFNLFKRSLANELNQ